MNSTQYGESLLANMQERNKKQAKDAEKRAQKNEWKQLGVDLLWDAADDILNKRQEEFLVNEDNLKAKLSMSKASDFATKVLGEEEAANKFSGGADAYWTAQALPSVEQWMSENYTAGTFNESTANRYKTVLASAYGKELQENHLNTKNATDTFLKDTGGVDNYDNFIRKQKPASIKGFVSNFIGKSTGLLDDDDLTVTRNKFQTDANTLNAFQEAYNQTGSTALAEFIADNKIFVPKQGELGTKAPEAGEPVKVDGPYGEVFKLPITHFDANGNVSYITTIEQDDSGTLRMTNPQVAAQEKIHALRVATVATDSNSVVLQRGQHIFSEMQPEQTQEIMEHIETVFEDDYNGSLSNKEAYNAFIKGKQNKFYANAGVINDTLQQQNFTSVESGKIASELILNSIDPENKNTKILSSVGVTNPYHTLHAIFNGVAGGMNKPIKLVDRLIRGNDLNFLNSYRSESTLGKRRIDDILKDNSNFGAIGVDDALRKTHQAVKLVAENPGNMFDNMEDSKALKAAYAEYAKPKQNPKIEKALTSKNIPVTEAEINAWANQPSRKNNLKIEGLSPEMINEVYGTEIKRYSNLQARREKNTKLIKDFLFTRKEKSARLKSLTYAERLVYNKTGKLPEDFK